MDITDLNDVILIENEVFTDAWSYDNFKYELCENEFSKSFVEIVDEKIIGYAVMYILFERAEVANITIKSDSQGKGYGCKLLHHMIDEAIKNDCEMISLEVRVSNHKAIDLYKKNGFEINRIRKSYYTDNYEDAYEMLKPLGGLNEKNICN